MSFGKGPSMTIFENYLIFIYFLNSLMVNNVSWLNLGDSLEDNGQSFEWM